MNLIEIAKKYSDGLQTITDWLGSGGQCVNIPQAQNRTDICIQCPHNIDGGMIPTVVASAIKRQVELKNSIGLRTNGIKKLKTCDLCTCYLPLKIFVPLDNLGVDEKEATEQFPSFCWMNIEYKLRKAQNEQVRDSH